jgi:glutamate racemase
VLFSTQFQNMTLHQPIGIFDAGIGSYAIVERVRASFPLQDIVYLADRASFPYGGKTPDELLAAVRRAAFYLYAQGCQVVVLASNAPSVMVLDALRAALPIPVFGVFPPLREALARSNSKQVAVFGVASLVNSEAMKAYVHQYAGRDSEVLLVNASALVDIVERFTFLGDPASTGHTVTQFINDIRRRAPALDVITMSSTHLPWLRPFFESAASDILFLDPADSVLEQLLPHASAGSGHTRCIATQTKELSLESFNAALQALGGPDSAVLATLPANC